MPLELINAIDEEVGDRERSEFIRSAIRKQLNADNDE